MIRLHHLCTSILIALAACGGGGTPTEVVEPPPPPPDAPLAIDVYLMRQPGAQGVSTPVGKNDVIHTGDAIELIVKPSRDAYVYVVQQFPDGTLGTLWP